jgi:hypothetical protein
LISKLFLPIVLLFIITFQPLPISAQDFPDVCQQPENILPNCNFDNGLNNWQTFIEDGAANFSVLPGGGECHAPLCPAAYIVTESHFVGGLYQQVPVATGNTYYANIIWLAFDSLANDASINSVVGGIGRRIGIDPLGGTDSRSANIVWGPDNWRNDCKICDNQAVTATAQADTITIFIRIDDTWRVHAAEKGFAVPPSKDQFWLDDTGLKQVAGDVTLSADPAEPLPTDTPLPPPPTDTPLPESPTDTPAPASNTPTPSPDTPAEIAQAESAPNVQGVSPIQTPTPALAPPPTLTPTHTPLPTNTPSKRPSPTPTRFRRPTPAPAASSMLPTEWLGVAGTTICVGGVVILMMAIVLVGLVWLYRLGWGHVGDDEPDQDFDDDEEIAVEIVE